MTRVFWESNYGHRVYGHIIDRRRADPALLTVRWDDGRVGTFVEGHEPDELHIAPTRQVVQP